MTDKQRYQRTYYLRTREVRLERAATARRAAGTPPRTRQSSLSLEDIPDLPVVQRWLPVGEW